MERFDRGGVSFVSVTQEFNTTTSMGRLTLNILLSFAQFEREIIGERTRDKQSAARRKGKWIGGWPVLGYDVDPKGGRLVVNDQEAEQVRQMYRWPPSFPPGSGVAGDRCDRVSNQSLEQPVGKAAPGQGVQPDDASAIVIECPL